MQVVKHDRLFETGRQLVFFLPLRKLSAHPSTGVRDELTRCVVYRYRNAVLHHSTLAESSAELFCELRLYPPFFEVGMIVGNFEPELEGLVGLDWLCRSRVRLARAFCRA